MLELLSFLGLPIGFLIAHETKEELKSGKKYFNLICLGIIIFLLGISLYYTYSEYYIVALPLVTFGFLITRFLIKKTYLGLGSVLPILQYFNLLAASSLIFLFGISYGSLNKFDWKKMSYSLIYFALPIIIFQFLNQVEMLFLFLGISIGSIRKWYTQF